MGGSNGGSTVMASELHVDAIKHSGGTSAMTINSSGNINIPGSIVQVVNGRVSDDRATTTSTSFTQLGDTLSITPKFSTSKIFMIAVTNTEITGTTAAYMDFGRTTGGTTTQNISGASNGITTIYQKTWGTTTYTFLDSPSTTSAVVYFCSVKVSAGTLYFNDNSGNNLTNFTLMEVAQ